MVDETLPPEFQFGKVVGRAIHAIADTADDPDDKPQARPAVGTVTFTPRDTLQVVTTPGYKSFVARGPETANLSSTGRILDGEGRLGIWLVAGVYDVAFSLKPLTTGATAPKIPPLTITVTTDATDANPFDLADAMPYTPPTGATVTTLLVPSGGNLGDRLTLGSGNTLVWAAPGSGVTGTTDASLLTSGILPAARIASGSITDSKLASGTALSPTERTRLAGMADNATANRADSATDTLLAAKAPLISPTFTGTVVVPTPTTGAAATTKSYVDTAVAGVSGGTPNSAFADIGTQSGVDNTGVTECAAAINSALTSFKNLGVRAYAKGTFKIASTVTVSANADLEDALFNYTGTTGTAVRIGNTTSGLITDRVTVKAPHVVATAKTTTGWGQVAGTIGVDISNVYSSQVTVPSVSLFETGLRVTGIGTGTSYTNVFLGNLENNKINLLMDPQTGGWANQNQFYGGRCSHFSNEGNVVAGTRHIELRYNSVHLVNNNTFYGTSVEANTAEYHLVCAGQNNVFDQVRWETTTPTYNPKVYWGQGANRNVIRGGYDVDVIVQTFDAAVAASSNNIEGFDRSYKGGGGSTGGIQAFENRSSGNYPALTFMNAGAQNAAAAQSAYGWGIGYSYIDGKRSTDTQPRMRLDGNNARTYYGPGVTTAPTAYAGFNNNNLELNGLGLQFAADNTYDIGASGAKPRYIRVGTAVQLGNFPTVSLPSAATAGAGAIAYDSTVAAPVYSNGGSWTSFGGGGGGGGIDPPIFTPAAATWLIPWAAQASSSSAFTLNVMYLFPYEVPADMTLDTARFETTVAASAGGVFRAGFYGSDSVTGLPLLTNKLGEFASRVTDDAIGAHDFTTTSFVVPRGLVYIAQVAQVAVPTLRTLNGWFPRITLPIVGTPAIGSSSYGYTLSGVTGALPSSGTPNSMTATLPIRLFLHTA